MDIIFLGRIEIAFECCNQLFFCFAVAGLSV